MSNEVRCVNESHFDGLFRRRRHLACVLAVGLVLGAACARGSHYVDQTSGAGGSATTAAGGGGAGGATATTTTPTEYPCGIDCSTIQTDDCRVAICNEVTMQCEVASADDGTACDDGLFCTIDDSCSAGVCTGGPQNDCGVDPGACDDVVCDEDAQSCSLTPKQNGATCANNTDKCLVNTTCQNGLCTGQTKDCFFAPVPNACHVAACNPQTGLCEPLPGNDGQPCTDTNDLCTINKTCTAGACLGGQAKSCSGLTQGCVTGLCDPQSGNCKAMPVMNGDLCDDLDPCTMNETCTGSVCGGGTAVTQCTDNDLCCPMGCTEQTDNDCGVPQGCKKTTVPGIVICISNNKVNTYMSASHCAACTEKGLTNACVDKNSCLQGFTNKIIEDLYFERTGMTCTAQAQQGPGCGWGEIMTASYQSAGVCPTPQDCTSSLNWANCTYGVGAYQAYIYGVCNNP